MKAFNQYLQDLCGLELITLAKGYKYTVFGGSTVVIEGHKGLCAFLPTQISFFVGGGLLKVEGSNLTIKCVQRQSAVVVGKIDNVAVSNG
ncbi:MAG: YabP/YqfC family sporulation protein [Clostridia bacterium]|nr:YabP/YqfC family sporulation protein [Clostridia bacterium]MBQ8505513.1 YabP/YqfC family sporulation protein [Clostridia bacterium]